MTLVLPTAGVTTQFPRLASDCSLSGKVLHIGHCLPARNRTTFPRLSSPRRHNFSYACHKVIHGMEVQLHSLLTPALDSGVPRNFVRGGGGSTNSVEDRGQRDRGSGGGGPLAGGFGGSCNLVQEISFHNKIFLIFGNLRLFVLTTNLFVIANVKQLRTDGSFRILLPFFFRTSWGCWRPKLSNFF